jgi:hypothetical protein
MLHNCRKALRRKLVSWSNHGSLSGEWLRRSEFFASSSSVSFLRKKCFELKRSPSPQKQPRDGNHFHVALSENILFHQLKLWKPLPSIEREKKRNQLEQWNNSLKPFKALIHPKHNTNTHTHTPEGTIIIQ